MQRHRSSRIFAGAKAGAALGATLGALVGGIGAAPGAIIGGLIGGFLGESAFKGIFKGIKALFGFKVGNEEEDEGPTDDSVDLTGEAVLSDDMVVESIGANPISIDGGSTNTVMGNLSEIGKKNRELIASQNESLVASITPRSKNNSDIAQSISNIEEGHHKLSLSHFKVEKVEVVVEVVVDLQHQMILQIDYLK